MTNLLFVYGTLRKSDESGMHAHLLAGCDLIGFGFVRGKLLEGTERPALVTDANHYVPGEVYALGETDAAFKELEAYVGPGYYKKTATIYMDDGTYVEAWVFYANS